MVEDMGDFGTGTTPPPPPGEQPAQSKSRSRARGAAAGVGVALVVGAGGIAVATSGSPSNTATPGASPTSEGAPTPGPHGGFPGGKAFGGGGGPLIGIAGGGLVLHGTYVVANPSGGYKTVQVQTGTVDSVTSTSLAVTSKDGFKFTYVVKAGTSVDAQRDGITSLKKGDEVVVDATITGSTGTVDRVTDTTELQSTLKNLPEGGFQRGGGPAGGGFGRGNKAPRSAPATPGTGT
jgi:hypothetical protein